MFIKECLNSLILIVIKQVSRLWSPGFPWIFLNIHQRIPEITYNYTVDSCSVVSTKGLIQVSDLFIPRFQWNFINIHQRMLEITYNFNVDSCSVA